MDNYVSLGFASRQLGLGIIVKGEDGEENGYRREREREGARKKEKERKRAMPAILSPLRDRWGLRATWSTSRIRGVRRKSKSVRAGEEEETTISACATRNSRYEIVHNRPWLAADDRGITCESEIRAESPLRLVFARFSFSRAKEGKEKERRREITAKDRCFRSSSYCSARRREKRRRLIRREIVRGIWFAWTSRIQWEVREEDKGAG